MYISLYSIYQNTPNFCFKIELDFGYLYILFVFRCGSWFFEFQFRLCWKFFRSYDWVEMYCFLVGTLQFGFSLRFLYLSFFILDGFHFGFWFLSISIYIFTVYLTLTHSYTTHSLFLFPKLISVCCVPPLEKSMLFVCSYDFAQCILNVRFFGPSVLIQLRRKI